MKACITTSVYQFPRNRIIEIWAYLVSLKMQYVALILFCFEVNKSHWGIQYGLKTPRVSSFFVVQHPYMEVRNLVI